MRLRDLGPCLSVVSARVRAPTARAARQVVIVEGKALLEPSLDLLQPNDIHVSRHRDSPVTSSRVHNLQQVIEEMKEAKEELLGFAFWMNVCTLFNRVLGPRAQPTRSLPVNFLPLDRF